MKRYIVFSLQLFCCSLLIAQDNMSYPIWSKVELTFTSDKTYHNVLYDIREFTGQFISPTGRNWTVDGFWDGDRNWKIRFAPDELGTWQFKTVCSDPENLGLHGRQGTFTVVPNDNKQEIYQRGGLQVMRGNYHFSYQDGTPFFWTACTAWNGALKSTEAEWKKYLVQRRENHYSVIQLVTTQWRGCERNAEGEVAFTGSGRIEINPDFFRRIDERVDQANAEGLIVSPVLLWALPFGDGRHLSPGYYLPVDEAVLLARYIVARLQGNQVVWTLGGDGRYTDEFEQRWKAIGRQVFRRPTQAPVTLHPHGRSWIGERYQDESWLDFVGYQSSHSNSKSTVDWITQGPMTQSWDQLPPKPIINMEPNYEEIDFRITAEDVRNASYWSIFATPVAGITYGANGIWPWIQESGELIENHGNPEGRGPSTWEESMEFPGSKQIGLLSRFIQEFDWWELKPAPELLQAQPGSQVFNHFISVAADDRRQLILAYTPIAQSFSLRLPAGIDYEVQWFDPIHGKRQSGTYQYDGGLYTFTAPGDQDWVLVLQGQ